MSLVRLIYASKKSEDMDIGAIQAILAEARENNSEHDITGLLYFNKNYFIQCLEGSPENVNRIYRSIINDERHTSPTLLDYRVIEARDFRDWSMGHVTFSDMAESTVLGYLRASDFDPFKLSGDAAIELMLELGKVATGN